MTTHLLVWVFLVVVSQDNYYRIEARIFRTEAACESARLRVNPEAFRGPSCVRESVK